MSLSILKLRRLYYKIITSKLKYSTKPKLNSITLNDKNFTTDDYTNVTPHIISFLSKKLHLRPNNPVSLVRQRIVNYFYSSFTRRGKPIFSVFENLSPIVTTKQNFDDLLVSLDHPSRVRDCSYYINRNTLLRAHMTAHQSELLYSGLDNFLMIGDVYRRDEINSSHYPVFHQVDAVRSQTKEQLMGNCPDLYMYESEYDQINPQEYKNLISDPAKQSCYTLEASKLMETQLKEHLIGLVMALFGKTVEYRWVRAFFPFTHPSWELEIFYNGEWMEVLGCGIVRNEILVNAGKRNSIAYAFGIGLERIAMTLYKIPDIRIMWSTDTGITSQFITNNVNANITYKEVSKYPQLFQDMSFWLPPSLTVDTFVENDFYDLVRDIGGDIVEQVHLKDKFIHPKTKKHSLCFRFTYRHPEKTLTTAEANELHKKIEQAVVHTFAVDIR